MKTQQKNNECKRQAFYTNNYITKSIRNQEGVDGTCYISEEKRLLIKYCFLHNSDIK